MTAQNGRDLTLTPYLSVVVTTRNDDHGGDPLKRLQAFVNWFDAQCRRVGLDAEIIVVEWNPTSEKSRVADLVRLPDLPFCSYRFVEVPPALHQRFQHSDVLPLFQMIAKNVGIRRARGEYVLATNIDVICSAELIDYLAARRLRPNRMYRVNRHDIRADYPIDAPPDRQMEYCRQNQLRVHERWGTYPVDRVGTPVAAPVDIADGRAVVLGRGWHVREDDGNGGSFRWASERAELIVDASLAVPGEAVLEVDLESNPYGDESPVGIAIVENGTVLRRVSFKGRISELVALGPTRADKVRRIQLAVDSSSSDQSALVPLFDLRNSLYYRVHEVRVRPVTPPSALFEYRLESWTSAYDSPQSSAQRTHDGLRVSTDPARYSYCIQQGPFRSPRRHDYRFVLRYALVQGNIAFGVMSGDRQRWIQASVKYHVTDGVHHVDVAVPLLGNDIFWLVISNNHPNGYGSSTFVIRELLGSADPVELACSIDGLVPTKRKWATSGAALRRRLSDAGDALVAWITARLTPRFRYRIVRTAPEHIAVEEAFREAAGALRQLQSERGLSDFHRFLFDYRPDNLHVNACGDFQLMARENWEALRGYPELETFSMNIDGVFSYMADAAGVKEEIIDAPIYHIEHEVGSGWSPEGEAALRRRIAERGITWIEFQTVYVWAAYMKWLRRSFIFNSSSWGFGDETLPERVVAPSIEQSAP